MAQCLYFYTYCSSLSVGCYLYTDEKRTTIVSAGWVSNGTNVYSVNSSGMITAITACSSCQPDGTFLNTSCSGCDLYYVYANGNCGTYSTFIESNSASCGCGSSYYCSCYEYDCDPYPNPCYYYSCNTCLPPQP
jgi:hypothetical protein